MSRRVAPAPHGGLVPAAPRRSPHGRAHQAVLQPAGPPRRGLPLRERVQQRPVHEQLQSAGQQGLLRRIVPLRSGVERLAVLAEAVASLCGVVEPGIGDQRLGVGDCRVDGRGGRGVLDGRERMLR